MRGIAHPLEQHALKLLLESYTQRSPKPHPTTAFSLSAELLLLCDKSTATLFTTTTAMGDVIFLSPHNRYDENPHCY